MDALCKEKYWVLVLRDNWIKVIDEIWWGRILRCVPNFVIQCRGEFWEGKMNMQDFLSTRRWSKEPIL